MRRLFYTTLTIAALGITGIAAAEPCIEYGAAMDDQIGLTENGQHWTVSPFVFYQTVVGDQDLFNSSGTRLKGYLSVLQQDRANVNRYNRPDHTKYDDPPNETIFTDQKDAYFTTPARRAEFQDMVYIPYCYMSPEETRNFQNRIENADTGFLLIGVFLLPDGRTGIHIDEAG